jgi:lysophospholipase L1-like esterase
VATIVWTLAIFGLAEGVVRIRAWYRHGTIGPIADIYAADVDLGRRPRAGARVAGADRQVTINRWGFRGRDLAMVKPHGALRVAAIGDSITFGMEAEDDESVWVSRLAERLREPLGPTPIEAINAAVPGYTLALSAERLLRDVAPFAPDIVIVLQTATDIAAHSRRQFASQEREGDGRSPFARLLAEHSLLINLVRQNAAPLLARWMPSGRHDRLDERGLQEYEDKLTRLFDECRRRGWRAVLCTSPRSFGDAGSPADQYVLAGTALLNNPALSLVGLNDAYDRYNDVIRDVAARQGATLVDLDRLVPRGRTYFVDATHLNNAGHALVAECVASALLHGDSRLAQDAAPHAVSPPNVERPPHGLP